MHIFFYEFTGAVFILPLRVWKSLGLTVIIRIILLRGNSRIFSRQNFRLGWECDGEDLRCGRGHTHCRHGDSEALSLRGLLSGWQVMMTMMIMVIMIMMVRYITGCIEVCDDVDGCNNAQNQVLHQHLLSLILILVFILGWINLNGIFPWRLRFVRKDEK